MITKTAFTYPIEPARRFWMTLLGSVPVNKTTSSASTFFNVHHTASLFNNYMKFFKFLSTHGSECKHYCFHESDTT